MAKIDLGLEIRNEVLVTALTIESMTSTFLAFLLGIEDSTNKLSFKGSTALSFNSKVMLLIDIGALDYADRTLFLTFMEVRNVFMHNIEASTFVKCFSYMEGKEAWILKKYKANDALDREQKLAWGVDQLSNDVLKLTAGIIDKLKKKAERDIEAKMLKEYQDASFKTIGEIKRTLDEFVQAFIDKGENIKPELIKELGTKISEAYYRDIAKQTLDSKKITEQLATIKSEYLRKEAGGE